MSDTGSTPVPPAPQPSQTPPKGGFLANQWVRYGIAFVLGLVLGGAAVSGAETATTADESPAAVQESHVSATPDSTTESPSPELSPSPEPEARLTKQDIELSLKTTEQQCFGSAGCNVTVQVRAAVDGALLKTLPSDGTWDVTYQIDGDESGPLIGTFSMYGNGKYDVNEEFLSTNSVNTPVRVKVLSVERF